jgi:Na+-translocating ferredoxin:NAD+ oxidoreductase RnfG subunit
VFKALRKTDLTIDESQANSINAKYGFEPNRSYTIYTGHDAEKEAVGSTVIVDIEGKEGPLQIAVAVDPDSGKVVNRAFTLFGEERGKPAAKKRFLSQFIGFDVGNRFELGKDVDAVTAATMTSTSVALGVRHAVAIFDHFIHGAVETNAGGAP